MNCPTCNAANRDDAKFCKGCGKRLDGAASAASLVPAATVAPVANATGTATSVDAAQEEAQAADEVTVYAVAPGQSEVETVAAAPAQPAPAQAPTGVGVEEIEDISLAPTQILTPQQMLAHTARRWQQEDEAGQADFAQQDEHAAPMNGQVAAGTPQQGQGQTPETGDAMQAPPVSVPDTEEDLADMPTVIMPPQSDEEPIPPPPPPPPSSLTQEAPVAQAPSQAAQGGDAAAGEANATTEEETVPASAPAEAEEKTNTKEGEGTEVNEEAEEKQENGAGQAEPVSQPAVEAEPASQPAAEAEPSASPTAAPAQFAALAVGATVAARYEISGVISEGEAENTYQVTDRQGYQRCWNCGSTQNAEGDEFCIDCGAELLNIPYTMHEYSSEQGQQEEAAVLQGAIVNTFVDNGRTYAIEQPLVEQNAFPTGVHLLAATDSDAGTVRRSEPNEDSTLALLLERVHESISMPVGVFIVADGLGGHDNGQLASRVAINVIAERTVRDLLASPLASEKAGGEGARPANLDEDSSVTLLHDAVSDANDVLVQMNQRDKTDMGSTLTGFMIVGDTAYIVNVGDSRTYMVRGGTIYQLTTDHSLVGQLVTAGLIQPEDVYTHPQRSQIFRSLGDKHNVQIDIFKQQLHPGDILLSCSDGLWEMVRNPQIESILTQTANPQTACTQLIEAANTNGGEDNVSAVVVFVS